MPHTTAAANLIATALTGGAYTPYNNANAHIGVGNGNGAFSKAQTDLQGASKFRQGMEASYPTVATHNITFRALFATGDANFAWEEWGVFNHASTGDMLNRKVTSLGTKTSAQEWEMTVTVGLDV